MHRFGTELLATITASVIMLAIVLLAGTAIARPAPRPATPPDGEEGACHELPVTALATSTVEGQGRVCFDDDGVVRPALQVGGLTPGHAYTAWLAYFDRPETCAQTPCSLVDLSGDDPSGVLGRISSGVANQTRTLTLRTELHDLVITPGAQLSLILLNHGQASIVDGRARARQLLTAEMPDLGSAAFGTADDGRRAFPHAQAVLYLR